MEHPARVVEAARGHEGIVPRSTLRTRNNWLKVRFANAENQVGRASELLPGAGVPPAELEVRARRPLAEEERVARAVGGVEETRGRILVEHPVVSRDGIAPRDTQIGGVRGDRARSQTRMRRSDAIVHRADERGDDRGQAGVRRVVEWILIELVSRGGLGGEAGCSMNGRMEYVQPE